MRPNWCDVGECVRTATAVSEGECVRTATADSLKLTLAGAVIDFVLLLDPKGLLRGEGSRYIVGLS